MIDINELRRLAQAATPGPWKACRNHECYEGAYFEIDPEDEAEYAAKPFTHIEARTGVVAAAHDLFEFDKEDAEFIAAANPATVAELLDRLEAAEKERDECNSRRLEAADHFAAQMALMKEKYDALRAKIEAMEQQEPVAWLHETRRDSDVVTDAVKHVWGKAAVGAMAAYSIPLYALPGAKGEEK